MFDNVKKNLFKKMVFQMVIQLSAQIFFKDYQLSVNKDKRLSGTWTLEQYEGQYKSAMYANSESTNQIGNRDKKFDTSILDNVTRESVEA